MKFRVQKVFELEPIEAAEVVCQFLEWLDSQDWTIEPKPVVGTQSDNRSFRELADDWAAGRVI